MGAGTQRWVPRRKCSAWRLGKQQGRLAAPCAGTVIWLRMQETTIAVVSVVSSAVVGIAGLLTATLTARANRVAELALVREERAQGRRADAYVALLELMERTELWAQNLKPIVEFEGQKPPDPARDENWYVVLAKLRAYGSPEVEALRAAWVQAVDEVARAAWDIEYRKQHRDELPHKLDGKTSFDLYRELREALKPAERAARDAVAARVHVELASGQQI